MLPKKNVTCNKIMGLYDLAGKMLDVIESDQGNSDEYYRKAEPVINQLVLTAESLVSDYVYLVKNNLVCDQKISNHMAEEITKAIREVQQCSEFLRNKIKKAKYKVS